MHYPREPHLSARTRILRYVRGTLDYGLQLFSSSTIDLVAYSDADWTGCPTTHSEVEYHGVANAVVETCWLKKFPMAHESTRSSLYERRLRRKLTIKKMDDDLMSIWEALRGYTRDLDLFGKKQDKIETLERSSFKNMLTESADDFEENKLEYEDENEVEIKMMGTGIDKESLEHNLYENDITSIICHKFSLTSNPPIKPKDSDPKQHYGFKPGLLGQSGSLGVDFSNLEVIENNFLKGLSLPMEKN
ncbi:ribonuclease H-like domain-containing protein [Tanacetum coccineum]